MSESIVISAAHRGTITSALNCERHQYQELFADCPDPYYTEKIAEIDAALQAIDQARQAQPSAPSARAEAAPSWEPMHEEDSATLRRNIPAIDALYQQGYAVCQLQPASASGNGVPDWADAPEWANFWAVDDNGRCFWYEYKPALGIRIWLAERGNNEICKQYPGWRNTLQARPRAGGQD